MQPDRIELSTVRLRVCYSTIWVMVAEVNSCWYALLSTVYTVLNKLKLLTWCAKKGLNLQFPAGSLIYSQVPLPIRCLAHEFIWNKLWVSLANSGDQEEIWTLREKNPLLPLFSSVFYSRSYAIPFLRHLILNMQQEVKKNVRPYRLKYVSRVS